MKRFFALLLVALPALLGAPGAFASRLDDVNISVKLDRDGSARIREVWTMDIHDGTEWSLVRSNLGDIRITDFTVTDENGNRFENVGEWNVDWPMSRKAGKCGIVTKRDGCELCWGLGTHGEHVFTAEYTMTNVVKTLSDADALHLQFVSPGIQPRPQHVRVKISSDLAEFSEENAAIWSFGYEGDVRFANGTIVAETDAPFTSDRYSVIVLARFDKGSFASPSVQDKSFEDLKEVAFYGSSYEEYLKKQKEDRLLGRLFGVFSALFCVLVGFVTTRSIRNRNRKMFGVDKIKEIGYERDLPFGGDIVQTRYVLGKCFRNAKENDVASAMILKMVKNGQIVLSRDANGKVLLALAEHPDLEKMSRPEKELLRMIEEASGGDRILQDREFARWSRKKANAKRLSDWVLGLNSAGLEMLQDNGYVKRNTYSPEGQQNARRAIGFKNYLKDFTIIGERKSEEVVLWQDYIIFGALYGMAEKVAKDLKEIDPKVFEEVVGYDIPTMNRVIFLSNNMSNSLMSAVTHVQTAASVGGKCGFASFGGGGGFSGGGFGGGAR